MRALLLTCLALVTAISPAFAQTIARLRPGDVFEMRLGGVAAEFAQDFNSQFTVSQEGSVNIPYIGEVQAVGLTPPQLQTSIQNRLVAGKIFTNPAVNINVMQGARFVTIGGSVRAPGRQQWTADLTLNTAINAAGGLSEWAKRKGIRLVREGRVQLYDLKKLEQDPSQDPRLLPGDSVVVPGD